MSHPAECSPISEVSRKLIGIRVARQLMNEFYSGKLPSISTCLIVTRCLRETGVPVDAGDMHLLTHDVINRILDMHGYGRRAANG